MKLLRCHNCHAVFSLGLDTRDCPDCGKCGGRYLDNFDAIWWGDAVPLGFANGSFTEALRHQPETGPGRIFEAFIIEKNCPTFRQEEPHKV